MHSPEIPDDRLAQILRRELGRRQRLTAALVLASCGVILVSAITWRDRQRLQRAIPGLAACERRCRSETPQAVAAFFSPAKTLSPPLDAGPHILDVPLEVVCPAGDIRDTTLADAAITGAVHLVNLWQLSCAGCKREFPLLGQAIADTGVAPARLRFLPIDDSNIGHPAEDYRAARTRHAMPTPSLALVDRDLAGARLLPALQQLAADTPQLTGDAPLVYPLSFVLDCEQRIRWWKAGAVSEDEAHELSRLLTELAASPTCRAQPPHPTVCNDPRRVPRPRHDSRGKSDPKASLSTPPVDDPLLPLPTPLPPDPDPAPPEAEPPPRQPAPAPIPAPAKQTKFASLSACESACHKPLACQAAANGQYTCAAPPAPL